MSPELPPTRRTSGQPSNLRRIANGRGSTLDKTIPAQWLRSLKAVALLVAIVVVPAVSVSMLPAAASIPLALFGVAILAALAFVLPFAAVLAIAALVR